MKLWKNIKESNENKTVLIILFWDATFTTTLIVVILNDLGMN